MAIDRKDFLKKVCFSGACLCGFSLIASPKEGNNAAGTTLQEQDKNLPLLQEWIKVSGIRAKAEVIASIRKGDLSCKYKIVFS